MDNTDDDRKNGNGTPATAGGASPTNSDASYDNISINGDGSGTTGTNNTINNANVQQLLNILLNQLRISSTGTGITPAIHDIPNLETRDGVQVKRETSVKPVIPIITGATNGSIGTKDFSASVEYIRNTNTILDYILTAAGVPTISHFKPSTVGTMPKLTGTTPVDFNQWSKLFMLYGKTNGVTLIFQNTIPEVIKQLQLVALTGANINLEDHTPMKTTLTNHIVKVSGTFAAGLITMLTGVLGNDFIVTFNLENRSSPTGAIHTNANEWADTDVNALYEYIKRRQMVSNFDTILPCYNDLFNIATAGAGSLDRLIDELNTKVNKVNSITQTIVAGNYISEELKLVLFIRALTPELQTYVNTTLTGAPKTTLVDLIAALKRYISVNGSMKGSKNKSNSQGTGATGAQAYAATTSFKNGKSANGTPKKCDNHPNSTSHTTAECRQAGKDGTKAKGNNTNGNGTNTNANKDSKNKKKGNSGKGSTTPVAESPAMHVLYFGPSTGCIGDTTDGSSTTTDTGASATPVPHTAFSNVGTPVNKYLFILDSGASMHCIMHAELATEVEPVPTPTVLTTMSGHRVAIRKMGKVSLTNTVALKNVAIVPFAHANLISVSKLIEAGANVYFKPDGVSAIVTVAGRQILEFTKTGGVYTFQKANATSNPFKDQELIVDGSGRKIPLKDKPVTGIPIIVPGGQHARKAIEIARKERDTAATGASSNRSAISAVMTSNPYDSLYDGDDGSVTATGYYMDLLETYSDNGQWCPPLNHQ